LKGQGKKNILSVELNELFIPVLLFFIMQVRDKGVKSLRTPASLSFPNEPAYTAMNF